MKIIELSDFTPENNRKKFKNINFTLLKGDAVCVTSDSSADAHLFLRLLSMRIYPSCGMFKFNGLPIDFSDYRNLLPHKMKIGYIAPDAALINTLSIRANLLLKQYYFNNSFNARLTETESRLCADFELLDKLDDNVADLHPMDYRLSVTVRELSKSPEVLILDHPEIHIGPAKFGIFVSALKKYVQSGFTLVFISDNAGFIRTFSNKTVRITDGRLIKMVS